MVCNNSNIILGSNGFRRVLDSMLGETRMFWVANYFSLLCVIILEGLIMRINTNVSSLTAQEAAVRN